MTVEDKNRKLDKLIEMHSAVHVTLEGIDMERGFSC